MTIKKINHDHPNPDNKDKNSHIQASLYYNSDKKRYWASIMPCRISDWAMECNPMDGQSYIVLRVENRRSKKTDTQAIELFMAKQEEWLKVYAPPVQELQPEEA